MAMRGIVNFWLPVTEVAGARWLLRFALLAAVLGGAMDKGRSLPFADLTSLPPLLVQVGTEETLFSDGADVVAHAQAAGVDAQLDVGEGLPHVSDMAFVSPIFASDELVGFSGSIAHKADIGGAVAGSTSANATEMYHEGLLIPPIKIWDAAAAKIMHTLEGHTGPVTVMKWATVKETDPFSKIEIWLGEDHDGNKQFHYLINKLTDLLGEPKTKDIRAFGDLDTGVVELTDGRTRVYVVSIEQFVCKYRLHIAVNDGRPL